MGRLFLMTGGSRVPAPLCLDCVYPTFSELGPLARARPFFLPVLPSPLPISTGDGNYNTCPNWASFPVVQHCLPHREPRIRVEELAGPFVA